MSRERLVEWFIYDREQHELARGFVTIRLDESGRMISTAVLGDVSVRLSGVATRVLYVWEDDLDGRTPGCRGAVIPLPERRLSEGDKVTLQWGPEGLLTVKHI